MDVYTSDATRFLVTENGLIPPLTSMPGIGEQAALSIVEERKNGKFAFGGGDDHPLPEGVEGSG